MTLHSIVRHALFLSGYAVLLLLALLWAQYAPHRDQYEMVEFQGRLERMLVQAARPEEKGFILVFALPVLMLALLYAWLIARLPGWRRRVMAAAFVCTLALVAYLRLLTL